MGKGFALRYGVARSRGQIVTFIDGDGDIDPAQIALYLRIMRTSAADIVVGSQEASRLCGGLPAATTALQCNLSGVAAAALPFRGA